MTYALGRGLTASDMPAVRMIAHDAQRENYRFSAVVLGIVRSVPFQMRIKGEQPERLASAFSRARAGAIRRRVDAGGTR
jgi:hypothetical protein